MNKSLKNDRDWLLEMIPEKKTEIIDDIHSKEQIMTDWYYYMEYLKKIFN